MNITIRKGEELHKIFADNKYVAYVDENDVLFGFSPETGYAVEIERGISTGNAVNIYRNWLLNQTKQKKRRSRKTELDLIKKLTNVLSVHDPESPVLHSALKYLKEVGK